MWRLWLADAFWSLLAIFQFFISWRAKKRATKSGANLMVVGSGLRIFQILIANLVTIWGEDMGIEYFSPFYTGLKLLNMLAELLFLVGLYKLVATGPMRTVDADVLDKGIF